MSNVGYYRYKISTLKEGLNTITFYRNGAAVKTATIKVLPFCNGFKLVKYLDSFGRYRFMPFNNKWQMTDKPTAIGSINRFIKSVKTSQSASINMGYKNTRTLSLVAENVPVAELDILKDLMMSPKVYLYVGAGNTDEISDWVEVTVKGDANTPRNRNFKKVTLEVELPEYYSIRL